MPDVGSIVFYAGSGVCRIAETKEMETAGAVRRYYVLTLLFKPASTLYVPCDSETLASRMVPLLELLMRNYTGIFSYPVPVAEDFLAASVGVGIPDLRQLLYRLSQEHVIRYVPGEKSDVITLHHNHLQQGNLDLQPKRYEMLRERSSARTEAIINYVSEDDTCRQSFLLDYFGQSDSAPCGKCDICRGK